MTNYVLVYLLLSLIGIAQVISSHRLASIALTTRPEIVKSLHREAAKVSSSIWSRAEPPSGMCDLFCPASAGPIRSGLISSCAYCARPSFGLGVIFRECPRGKSRTLTEQDFGPTRGGGSSTVASRRVLVQGQGVRVASVWGQVCIVCRTCVQVHWRCVSFVLVLRCFGCLSSQAPSSTLMLILSLRLCSLLPPAPALRQATCLFRTTTRLSRQPACSEQ